MKSYLEGETYKRIDNSVKELIEDYSIKEYPLKLCSLTTKMGIELIPYSYAARYGIDTPKSISEDAFARIDRRRIFYNEKAKVERLRFSVAHEIGHIWLEHESDCKRNEAEANHFASYLLAPTPMIVELGFDDAFDISEYFSISYEAACCALRRAKSRKRCGVAQESYEYEIVNLCHCERGWSN